MLKTKEEIKKMCYKKYGKEFADEIIEEWSLDDLYRGFILSDVTICDIDTDNILSYRDDLQSIMGDDIITVIDYMDTLNMNENITYKDLLKRAKLAHIELFPQLLDLFKRLENSFKKNKAYMPILNDNNLKIYKKLKENLKEKI